MSTADLILNATNDKATEVRAKMEQYFKELGI